MNASMLGLFSGFPTRHFTDEIAGVLRDNLPRRESLVFISAWPEDYARNDEDSGGMHGMFAERGMAFARHRVIDRRTGEKDAVKWVREADCIFLMGGEPASQIKLIRDLGLVSELLSSRAVILGVSAGTMNMGRYAADVWETKELYEGIGLTDITVKAHYMEGEWFIPVLNEISMIHPVAAMEDESAIFVRDGVIWKLGSIHWIDKGRMAMLTDDMLEEIAKDQKMKPKMDHEKYMKRCYALAVQAGKKGFDTFGALLVHGGEIVEEAENTADWGKGIFGHAEFNLVHQCANRYSDAFLKESTVYTSCAPCERCLCAIASLGVEQVVFGVSYEAFSQLTPHGAEPIDREGLLGKLGVRMKLTGPVLEEEGMRVFEWWGGEYRPLKELIAEMAEVKAKTAAKEPR